MPKSKVATQPDAANPHSHALIESALRTLEAEAGGVTALAAAMRDGLGGPFVAAIALIRGARGRLPLAGDGGPGAHPAQLPTPERGRPRGGDPLL